MSARLVCFALALGANALGALISLGTPGPDLNNSIQASSRILEVQNTGAESGCISRSGAADVTASCAQGGAGFTGGDDTPQTQTRTLSALAIANGSDLRIVFDAVEPSGNGITLSALRLILQNGTTGALIFVDNLASPVVLASTLTGTGKSDVVLGLNAAGIAAYDAAVASSGLTLAQIRVGLYANLTDAAGGPEAFYVVNQAAVAPEPGTYLLTAVGLLALGMRRRRQ